MIVPDWSGCGTVTNDAAQGSSTPWTSTCVTTTPRDVTADFSPYRDWYVQTMEASAGDSEQAVEWCYATTGNLTLCDEGQNGVPSGKADDLC